MPIFDSPVNILERVVYKAKHNNKIISDMMINNGADENLIGNFAQEPVTITTQKNTWYKKSVLEAAILKKNQIWLKFY
ncbi:hypothetical protein [Spiroplasma endosymbiont of Colias croceus]|uniref:hypothetical protein n=1 Tax=Spiroplasma endosymbiont of Colias croceus TaxID=3066310 RepID=UPI0030D44916